MKDDRNDCIRTTIYLPRHMHESAKMMAVLTRSNVSTLMRWALSEKLSKIKAQYKKDKTEDILN